MYEKFKLYNPPFPFCASFLYTKPKPFNLFILEIDEAEELPDFRLRSRTKIRTAALQILLNTRLVIVFLWHYRYRRLGKYLFNYETDRYLPDYYKTVVKRRILLFNFFEISRETILNLTTEIKRI